MNLKENAKKLKTYLPAMYLALQDSETPFVAKLLASITVAYALSPIDLIPDFIPVLGYLDDLILLPALCAWTIRLIPKSVMERSLAESAELWKDGKPKKWYYGIGIVLLWLLILYLILKKTGDLIMITVFVCSARRVGRVFVIDPLRSITAFR